MYSRTVMDNNIIKASEKDEKRSTALGSTKPGEGHDNFLNGVIVQFDMYAPLFMWKQLQRYHFLDFISSQSTMHRLTKFDVRSQCVEDTDPIILKRYQKLLDDYNKDLPQLTENKEAFGKQWRTLVASLPSGFVLGATMTTNYRELKTIYLQRKHHKLDEWKLFCEWCETLPKFKELCIKE